ncbi:unnamed protein product, partial [marine sediment metagenome]
MLAGVRLRPAKRMKEIPSSSTFKVLNLAKELERQGKDIVHMEVGEPDFDTPAHIKRAAEEALARGMTKYTSSAGLPELREAIAEHLATKGISTDAKNVIVTPGAKHAIFCALAATLEEFGGEGEAFWYADDFDPMRRIPWPLNEGELAERYKQYLGMPYIDIPSPDPKYKNFVDYFARPFIESLDDFGVDVKVYSGAEIYRSGKMADPIRIALEKADKIRTILNRYRSKPLPEDWLPYDALCERCGKLATTRSYSWHDNYVSYRC